MAQDLYVELQLRDGAAEGVAVHAQLPRRLTLISLVFLQNCKDEPLLKLANRLRIEDPTLMHLKYQGFQLIFHSASLFINP